MPQPINHTPTLAPGCREEVVYDFGLPPTVDSHLFHHEPRTVGVGSKATPAGYFC